MIKVGIVGGTGYTGVELMRLLARHPSVGLEVITSRSEAGTAVADLFPNLRGHVDLEFSEPLLDGYRDCDLVFFATPNATAMTQAQALLETGIRVIDLAADFRIKDVATWEQWYGATHACPELVAEKVDRAGLDHCRLQVRHQWRRPQGQRCYRVLRGHRIGQGVRGAGPPPPA